MFFLSASLLLASGCGSNRHRAAQPHVTDTIRTLAIAVENAPALADGDAKPSEKKPEHQRLQIKLDATEIGPGEALSGSVEGAWDDDVVRVLWVDAAGRVVSATDVSAKKSDHAAVPFSIKTPAGCMGRNQKLLLVRADRGNVEKARKDGTDAAWALQGEAQFRLNLPSSGWSDYLTILEAPAASPQAWNALRANGVTAGWTTGAASGPLAAHAIPFIADALPRENHPLYSAAADANTQGSAFDEASLDHLTTAMEKNVESFGSARPSGWSLGNAEGVPLQTIAARIENDQTDATNELRRAWLEERYGKLAALNKQWGATFKDWNEVHAPPTDEVKSAHNGAYATKLDGEPEKEEDAEDPETPEKPQKEKPAAEKVEKPKKEDAAAEPGDFTLQPDELRTPGKENFSPWSDARAFDDFATSRLLREYRARLRQLDPAAKTGLVGAQAPSAWGGWDWWQLARSVDWLEEHNAGYTRTLVRSFAPSTRCVSKVFAGQPADLHALWERWLRGDAGCILAGNERWLKGAAETPDLQALSVDLKEMANGATLQRDQAKPAVEPVAVYYSPRSVHLHWMLDSEADGSRWLQREAKQELKHSSAHLQFQAWFTLLEDLGFGARFVHPSQVLAGELQTGTKILILPKVLSLTEAEAHEIRLFARRGGIVIADGACGTFDGTGRRRPLGLEPRPVGPLDADFGVGRKNFLSYELNGQFVGDPESARVRLRDAVTGQPLGPDSPELRVLEPGIVPIGSVMQAKGASPAMISRPHGLGRFIYLNLCLQDYPQLRAAPAQDFRFHGIGRADYAKSYGEPTGGEALRLVVSDILTEVLKENALKVRAEDGTPLRGIRRTAYDLGGGAEWFALLPLAHVELDQNNAVQLTGLPFQQPKKAWVGTAQPRHWYDSRSGEYLGYAAQVEAQLDPYRPTFLAALPYKVERLALKLRRTDARGAFKLQVALQSDGAEPAKHVLHLEISGPDGAAMPQYSRNIVAEKGAWTGTIALGLNEPAGRYKLTLRDVLTGKRAEGELLKELVEYAGVVKP